MRFNKKRALLPMRGGLGNQMFIYAFSKFLNKHNFVANFVWYEYIFTKHHHGIELYNAFNIVNTNERYKYNFFLFINRIITSKVIRSILGKIFSIYFILVKKIKQSTPYSYDLTFLDKENKLIFLDGFWQNCKYLDFKLLSNEFKFQLPGNYQNLELHFKILNSESVSVHIRRGDYLEDAFKEFQVINGPLYYFNAMKKLRVELNKPLFFVFTDDFDWVRSNIVGDDIIYVNINHGANSYLDMYLMSQCKNNIISNSTFSFWGAFLNSNVNKIVICPEYWTTTIKSQSFCPDGWNFVSI